MNNFLRRIWGSSESLVFRGGAWGVALALAIATSGYRPTIDWTNKSAVEEHNNKIKAAGKKEDNKEVSK